MTTQDIRFAVWLFVILSVVVVFLGVIAIDNATEADKDRAADRANQFLETNHREEKKLRLFERQVEALEAQNALLASVDAASETFDFGNTIDLCEEGEGCPPRVIHVLEYMGAVAAGNVSRGTSDCIADKYENGETWSLQEPMWGLSTGSDGDFSNMQVAGTLTHIWQCRDK